MCAPMYAVLSVSRPRPAQSRRYLDVLTRIAREWSHGPLCRSTWIAVAHHDPCQVWHFSRWASPDYFEAALDALPREVLEEADALLEGRPPFVRYYAIRLERQFGLRPPTVAVLSRYMVTESVQPGVDSWTGGPGLERLVLPGSLALRHAVALDNETDYFSVGESEDPVALARVGKGGLRPPMHIRDYGVFTGRIEYGWVWPGTVITKSSHPRLALGA